MSESKYKSAAGERFLRPIDDAIRDLSQDYVVKLLKKMDSARPPSGATEVDLKNEAIRLFNSADPQKKKELEPWIRLHAIPKWGEEKVEEGETVRTKRSRLEAKIGEYNYVYSIASKDLMDTLKEKVDTLKQAIIAKESELATLRSDFSTTREQLAESGRQKGAVEASLQAIKRALAVEGTPQDLLAKAQLAEAAVKQVAQIKAQMESMQADAVMYIDELGQCRDGVIAIRRYVDSIQTEIP